MSGKVYLVGGGPGDAGLLTCKGKWLLDRADVVVYDALVGDAVLGGGGAYIMEADVRERWKEDC